MNISLQRVYAIVWRHLHTWPRDLESLFESFWWPSFDVLIWGIMTVYVVQNQNVSPTFTSVIIAGIVFWMFVYRSQQEIGFVFLREFWERNLLSLLTSPLSINEFLLASFVLGLIKLCISAVWMMILAYMLFSFSLIAFGWYLVPIIGNLLCVGWAAGLCINGLILRYGYRVQSFAWSLVAAIQPFSAVFYPLSSMPVWMQWIAKILPTSYIFEDMRGIVSGKTISPETFFIATGLNVFYLIVGYIYFQRSFTYAKRTGMVLKFS